MLKNILKVLLLSCLLLNCSKNDDSQLDDKVIWEGVFYDGMLKTDVHDPQYNYTLIIDSLGNIEIILPTEVWEEKVISIEVLNDSEMDVTWNINNDVRVVRTSYKYNNQNELIIDKFTPTEATIPFPNNLTSAKFIRETATNP